MLIVVSYAGFGGWMYPILNVVRNGGTGMLPVMHMLEGLREAAGAERRPQRRLFMAPVGSQIAAVDDGMTWGAEVNRMVL